MFSICPGYFSTSEGNQSEPAGKQPASPGGCFPESTLCASQSPPKQTSVCNSVEHQTQQNRLKHTWSRQDNTVTLLFTATSLSHFNLDDYHLQTISCLRSFKILSKFLDKMTNNTFFIFLCFKNKIMALQTLTFLGSQKHSWGLPWWRSGWESACQCKAHGFEPWSGKIPHAAEQLGPWATVTEPERLEPVLHNKRGRDGERPAHRDEEWPPLAATRESLRTETKTQHSQK